MVGKIKPRKKMTRKDYEKLAGLHQTKKKSMKGGSTLAKNLPFLLNTTARYNPNFKQRRALIETLTPGQHKALKKIANNFIEAKLPVSTKVLKKIAKEKNDLYKLAEKKSSLSFAKKFLNQKGGIAGALIPLALSLVPDLLSSILKI